MLVVWNYILLRFVQNLLYKIAPYKYNQYQIIILFRLYTRMLITISNISNNDTQQNTTKTFNEPRLVNDPNGLIDVNTSNTYY